MKSMNNVQISCSFRHAISRYYWFIISEFHKTSYSHPRATSENNVFLCSGFDNLTLNLKYGHWKTHWLLRWFDISNVGDEIDLQICLTWCTAYRQPSSKAPIKNMTNSEYPILQVCKRRTSNHIDMYCSDQFPMSTYKSWFFFNFLCIDHFDTRLVPV